MEDALDKLLSKQACIELIHKLARGLDRCDEPLLNSLFHEDATDDHGEFKGTAHEFIAMIIPVLKGMERTFHQVSNILIDVDGDVAWGEIYFVANHDFSGKDGTLVRHEIAGRYMDRFERRGGEWRIAHHGVIYDWSATQQRTDSWDRTASDRRFGDRAPHDAVYTDPANWTARIGDSTNI